MLLFLMPWVPWMPARGLDISWVYTLNYAFKARLQYGPDLTFVYGPLGFVQLGSFEPAVYPWIIAIRAPILILLGLLYFKLLRPLPFVFAAALAVTIVAATNLSLDAAFGSAAVLATLILSEADAGIADYVELALLCGAVSLMKFPYFITISAVYLTTALYRALRWREYPVPLALWAFATVVGSVLSGQHLSSLPEYLRSSYSMAVGYGEAMQTFGPHLEAVRFGLLAAALLVVFALHEYRRQGAWAIFPLSVVTLVVVVISKDGFVRQDLGHQLVAVPLLLTTIALCSAWMCRRRFEFAAATLFVVAAVVFAITIPELRNLFGYARRNLVAIDDLVENGTRNLDAKYESSLHSIRTDWPLPKVSGDADIYSFDQTVLFAGGIRYHPRPEFQSLTAYTQYLIERNVKFLKSPTAPATIFFNVEPIDGRLAAFEDGASWPELLTRYDVTDDTGKFLRLDRRAVPRTYTLSPLLTTTIHLGETLKIDGRDNSLIWVRIDLEKTMLGRILAILTKAPLLMLEVTLRDGTSHAFRILPAAAAEGFLLSPVVESRIDFLALDRPELRAYLTGRQVEAIRIVPRPFARAAYRDEVPVVIETLKLNGSPPPIKDRLAGEIRNLPAWSVPNSTTKP